MRKRKYRVTPKFLGVIAIVGIATTLGMLFLIIRLTMTYIHSRAEYKQIAQAAVIEKSPQAPETTVEMPLVFAETQSITPSPTPAAIVPISIDWVNVQAMNKQIVAWLYCEGLDINYPIVKGKDNKYYLTHNAKKKEDQAGALFLDYRNELGVNLENLIIYGHRMKDGSMFGKLAKFSESGYVNRHTFYLLTPTQDYKIEVFACRTVHPEVKYFPTSFTNEDAEDKYCQKAEKQSYWQKAPKRKTDGAILVTLATCSKYDYYEEPRLLVHGWAIPING
jgi:SrtB family sortase